MSQVVAIFCSGQGTQHPGMFDLVTQAAEAQPILDSARELLDGKDPQRFVREADPATLFSNRAGQILCCTQALAAWAMIRPRLSDQVVLAGYSVGELAAWGCAGLIAPAEVLRLAARRAEWMDEAGGDGGGLAAVTGLRQADLEPLCRSRGVYLAIINGDEFFVVGGRMDALEAMRGEALRAGATSATALRVAVASHTPLLARASERFGEILDQLDLPRQVPAGMRLLSGVDGEAVLDVPEGRRKLAAQISHALHWSACLENCHAAGAEKFLELGPGRALTQMASRTWPDARARSTDDFRTPAGVLAWLTS